MEQQRSRFLTAAIMLIALLLLFAGIRMAISHDAAVHLESVKTRINVYQDKVTNTETRLELARKSHLKVYLAGFSVAEPRKRLDEALGLLKLAEKAKHPAKRVRLADQAMAKVQGMSLTNISAEIDFLDNAKKCWKTESATLVSSLTKSRDYIDGLEKQGYFASHFIDSRKLLDAAGKRKNLAVVLSSRKFEGNSPDYRRIYANCVTGEKYCLDATNLAKAIPEAKSANQSRIYELPGDISSARARYESAWYAARRLEQYPNYQYKSSVRTAFNNLLTAEKFLTEAKSANSFEVQDFTDAAKKLSRAEQVVTSSKQQMETAIDTWSNLQSSISAIPDARDAAAQRINEAQDHINSYSENSQTSAEEYLSEARRYRTNGDGLEDSDPIESLNAYQNAKSKADEAYDEVDTVDHSSPPPSSDSGGSGYDYGSGSSDSGSSSSNYPSDSGSSSSDYSGGYSGGSSDSSPSGSSDSSPSGSYNSSPSGSYGDGL